MQVRDFLEKYPDRGFHMMTPGGFIDLPPGKARGLLNGESVKAHPGNPAYGVEWEADEVLSMVVTDVKWEKGVCYMMADCQGAQEGQGEELEKTMENEKMLKERLKACYEAYIQQVRQKPAEELIEMASEIAAAKFIYEELSEEGAFGEYAGYLLQFEDPLEVLQDNWMGYEDCDCHEEIENMLRNMKDKGIGIGDYPMAGQAGEGTQSQGVTMC